MARFLRQFETLSEPVTSPSGAWALCYDTDGRAVIRHHTGTVTWSAGSVGLLSLETAGVFTVYEGDQPVWRSHLPSLRYTSLRITDDGDGMIDNDGLPVFSLAGGPIEPVSLGNKAPAAEIHGNRFLESDNGNRTVNRAADDDSLVCKTGVGVGATMVNVVQPEDARSLEQPDRWLTWQFFEGDGHGSWKLVLVGHDDEILWVHGDGHDSEQVTAPLAVAEHLEGDDWPQPWMDTGLQGMAGGYCITVIHDLSPDDALRRFGATDDEISTSTWTKLLRRASYEEAYDHHVVAAFALGPHTLLVENNALLAADRPTLSRGTFAVSFYRGAAADQTFLISRDGETPARYDENCPSHAEDNDADLLREQLAEMGVDTSEAFAEKSGFCSDLELLCRVANVRPTETNIAGPARVAILSRQFPLFSHP